MRERRINFGELIPLLEEKLAGGGEVHFSPNGTSMLPTLKAGRDTLIFVSPPPKLRKYDIALYKRENGQYVLHRVVCVGKNYTFIGDNQLQYEHNVEHGQIIALCTACLRDGKRVELNSFRSRAFARLWHHTRFLRRAKRAVALKLKAILKR